MRFPSHQQQFKNSISSLSLCSGDRQEAAILRKSAHCQQLMEILSRTFQAPPPEGSQLFGLRHRREDRRMALVVPKNHFDEYGPYDSIPFPIILLPPVIPLQTPPRPLSHQSTSPSFLSQLSSSPTSNSSFVPQSQSQLQSQVSMDPSYAPQVHVPSTSDPAKHGKHSSRHYSGRYGKHRAAKAAMAASSGLAATSAAGYKTEAAESVGGVSNVQSMHTVSAGENDTMVSSASAQARQSRLRDGVGLTSMSSDGSASCKSGGALKRFSADPCYKRRDEEVFSDKKFQGKFSQISFMSLRMDPRTPYDRCAELMVPPPPPSAYESYLAEFFSSGGRRRSSRRRGHGTRAIGSYAAGARSPLPGGRSPRQGSKSPVAWGSRSPLAGSQSPSSARSPGSRSPLNHGRSTPGGASSVGSSPRAGGRRGRRAMILEETSEEKAMALRKRLERYRAYQLDLEKRGKKGKSRGEMKGGFGQDEVFGEFTERKFCSLATFGKTIGGAVYGIFFQIEALETPVEVRAIRMARAAQGPPYFISVYKHENEGYGSRGCLNQMDKVNRGEEHEPVQATGLLGREADRRKDGYWCADRWTKIAEARDFELPVSKWDGKVVWPAAEKQKVATWRLRKGESEEDEDENQEEITDYAPIPFPRPICLEKHEQLSMLVVTADPAGIAVREDSTFRRCGKVVAKDKHLMVTSGGLITELPIFRTEPQSYGGFVGKIDYAVRMSDAQDAKHRHLINERQKLQHTSQGSFGRLSSAVGVDSANFSTLR